MKSSLHINATQIGSGRTILENCFFNPPFKVADITEDRSGDLQLMLMSASPGVLDGDEYNMELNIEENARLHLHTQSYQRIYTMERGASQNNTIHIGRNARLCFIPHPVVPHRNASLVSRTNIYLEENAELLWAEIISCGRKLNGEVFRFSKYHSKTSVYYKDRLVLKENLLLQPASMSLSSIGQLQQFTHQATLIFLNENFAAKDLKEKLLNILSAYQNTRSGITQTAFPGLMIRVLGQHSEELFECIQCLSKEILANQKTVVHAI